MEKLSPITIDNIKQVRKEFYDHFNPAPVTTPTIKYRCPCNCGVIGTRPVMIRHLDDHGVNGAALPEHVWQAFIYKA